jgi:hypothetical protein
MDHASTSTTSTASSRSIKNILINIFVGLVISAIVGAILTWLIAWIFPQVNPPLSQILTSFDLPYQELILKLGWFGFAFGAGLALTMAVNLPVQWIRSRLQRWREARSA